MVAATGEIKGNRVVVFASDATLQGGALGADGAHVIVEAYKSAMGSQLPIIGIWHSGGARLRDGVSSLSAFGEVFQSMITASGRIPQLSLVLGPTAGGGAYGPALTDVVVLAPNGRIFVTGPDVVKSVTGEKIDIATLGGPDAHRKNSGVAHVIAHSEEEAFAEIRDLASLFADQGLLNTDLVDEDLAKYVPAVTKRAYEVHPLVNAILDSDAEKLELLPMWAENMTTVLGRFGGRTVGVLANNPQHLGGVLDSSAGEKAARLRALLDDAELEKGRRVDASDVGFRLGPRLNAVGRLGHAKEAVELLITDDPARARTIVKTLADLNEQRRKMDREYFEQACARIDADPAIADAGAIVLADERWHEGVVGIVAAKISERHGKPAILMALRADGTAKGSGRSIEGLDILAAVKRVASDLMIRGGGHAYALGLTVRAEDVPEFTRRVSSECTALASGGAVGPIRRYDAEAEPAEMTATELKPLEILRPFGRGNPEPAFLIRNVRPVAAPTLFGSAKNHVEFFLPGGSRCIWWSAVDRSTVVRQGVPIDLIVKPSIEVYRGVRRVQLVVQDIRASQG
jgi:acetyl-CoA carboxylase beta subunit